MAGFSVVLNPTSDPEVAHTAQLNLSDAAVNNGIGYRLVDGTAFPPPTAKPAYASSYDTEGAISSDEPHYDNREIILRVRVAGSSASDLESKLNALTKMVGQIQREGGSLKLTTPNNTVCYFDLERESEPQIPFDRAYANNRRCDCTVVFQARPFWRGAESGNLTDDFSVDTIGSGAWVVDTGTGLAITGGKLTSSATTTKRLHRTDLDVSAAQIQVTHRTPAAFGTTYIVGVYLKWLDDNNMLYARVTEDGATRNIQLRKRDGGSDSAIATFTAPAALTAATTYGLLARLEGNKVTVEHLDASGAPLTGGGTHMLTGGNDTKFGLGVEGKTGLTWAPVDNSATLDDFIVNQNVYAETSLPVVTVGPVQGAKGDVPALGRLVVTDTESGGKDRWTAIVGGQSSRYLDLTADLSDNFSMDTIGSGAWVFDSGGGTLSVSGGLLVPSTTATKQLYRPTPTYVDTETMVKITLGASAATVSGVIARRLDASNALYGLIRGGSTLLEVGKIDGGVVTALATTAFSPSASTSYWVRLRCAGNRLTIEVFTSAPTSASIPVATTTATLTGADATKYGAGVTGTSGLRVTPAGTDERYDDFSVTPLVPEAQEPFYEAETFTVLGGSTKTSGASGASGSSNNVIRNTDLTTTYQAVLKSEIDYADYALRHKGTYRVWARLYRPTGNTGAVSVRLEWAEGDYTRVTLNDPVAYAADEREGVFTWANLGIVSIDPESTRWEFRLLATSTTVGDELDVDCFALMPTEVVYTELSARLRYEQPSSFSAADEFDQTAGALTGKTARIGGTWAGAGDASIDWQVHGSGLQADRTVTSGDLDADLNTGRYAVSGVAAFAAQVAQIDMWRDAAVSGDVRFGVLARYTDTSNWLLGHVLIDDTTTDDAFLCVTKRVAGTVTEIARVLLVEGATGAGATFMGGTSETHKYRLRLHVDAAGRWFLWWGLRASTPELVLRGQDSVLATGGALDDGKPGFYVAKTSGSTNVFFVDNFLAFAPTPDAAIFAGQSLELRHDKAQREDSAGGFYSRVSYPNGRYLKVPASGPEGRSTRLVVLALPNDPYTMGDAAAIYDTSAQLFVTPRGLVVPEA